MKKYTPFRSPTFEKSLKRVSQWPSFVDEELQKTIDLLASGATLPPQYKDHKLSGSLSDLRECHIRSDLLLIYKKRNDILILTLVNIGSHSSLFKK